MARPLGDGLIAATNSVAGLGNQMRTLLDLGALGAMPDRGLLEQFVRGGETSQAAFSILVERHEAMVPRVCWQVLADRELAADALQVMFLLLARRASSIRDPVALAGLLHRVARRVVLRPAGNRRRTSVSVPRCASVPSPLPTRRNVTRFARSS